MPARRPCRPGLVGLLTGLALASPAAARTWRLESGRASPRVEQWGPDCGPAPTHVQVPPGALYEETPDGSLQGEANAPPLFGTGLCRALTHQPDLREDRAGETMSCASPEGAAKRVSVRAARRVLPSGLQVDQTTHYAWTLKGTQCAVEVAGRYQLVDPAPPLAPADACASPGPLATLRPVGAARRLVPVDGRVALAVRATDASGCALALRPAWGTSGGAVAEDGTFDARGLTPGTAATVTARIGDATVDFVVRIAANDADYAALTVAEPTLAEGRLPVLPPQHGEALTGAAANDETAQNATLRGRLLVGAFVGFLVMAALLGVGIAVRAARRRPDRAAEVLDENARQVLARSAAARQRSAAREPPGRICPVCGVTYPADAEFCGTDGTRLTRLN